MASVDEDEIDLAVERREIERRRIPEELRDPARFWGATEPRAAVPHDEVLGVRDLVLEVIDGVKGGQIEREDVGIGIVVSQKPGGLSEVRPDFEHVPALEELAQSAENQTAVARDVSMDQGGIHPEIREGLMDEVRRGSAEFALIVEPPVIVLAYCFGESILWTDVPYSWHLQPAVTFGLRSQRQNGLNVPEIDA